MISNRTRQALGSSFFIFKKIGILIIRKTNLALEAVFSENELNELLNNEEMQDDKEKITTFQGFLIFLLFQCFYIKL